MKNVLVIAYHYPPVGGAAVQRNTQIVRHLPAFGYQPIIVTGAGTRESRWTPHDDSMMQATTGFRVVRMAGEDDIPESPTWRGRAERWLGVERPWSRWWAASVLQAVESISEDIDVVYAPIVPYDTHRAALRVRELLQRPLVIDLHDPWAFDEMMVYPTRAHRQSAQRLMRRVLMASDGIAINTPDATARIVQAFPELAERSVATIPNGYSSDDFVGEPPARGDAFRIVHTGYLHTELGQENQRLRFLHSALGGMLGDVDILTRSHVYLLQAVEELLKEEPGLGPIEIHLAGVATPADREAAGGSKLVHFHGYVPHTESVRLLRSADLLFLPMHNLTEGRRVGIIPGKTYEYVAAERPILAAIPPGDARDLLLEAGNSAICGPNDVEAMKRELRAAIGRKRAGHDDSHTNEKILARIEWRSRSRSSPGSSTRCVGQRTPTNLTRSPSPRPNQMSRRSRKSQAHRRVGGRPGWIYAPSMGYATPAGDRRSITAVIPAHNRERLIERAVDSVLAQERPADEIIVVDDGSSDQTAELVKRYGDRVKLISQTQSGVSVARNTGVEKSSSEFIAFLDSDDIWAPSHLRRMENAIVATGGEAVLYFSDLRTAGDRLGDTYWELAGLRIDGRTSSGATRPTGSSVPCSRCT